MPPVAGRSKEFLSQGHVQTRPPLSRSKLTNPEKTKVGAGLEGSETYEGQAAVILHSVEVAGESHSVVGIVVGSQEEGAHGEVVVALDHGTLYAFIGILNGEGGLDPDAALEPGLLALTDDGEAHANGVTTAGPLRDVTVKGGADGYATACNVRMKKCHKWHSIGELSSLLLNCDTVRN